MSQYLWEMFRVDLSQKPASLTELFTVWRASSNQDKIGQLWSLPDWSVHQFGNVCSPLPDGELYTGTVSNFQGNEPVIYKSLGQGTALKTENSLKWLQGECVFLIPPCMSSIR